MGKTSKRINVQKLVIGFKKLKLKEERKKRGKIHRTAKVQYRGRGYNNKKCD